jgi:hypothetical protein
MKHLKNSRTFPGPDKATGILIISGQTGTDWEGIIKLTEAE